MPDITPSPLVAVLGALRRRWRLSVLCALVVVAVWVPFVQALPDLYRASATILVSGSLSDSINQSSDAAARDLRLQAIKQESLSRAQLTELLDRFDLYPEMRTEVSSAEAIDRLQEDIELDITSTAQRSSGGTNTVAFTLSYLGRDPTTVAAVTNTVASYYVAQNSSLRAKAADGTMEFLKTELADARSKLDKQEQRVSAFTSRNVGGSPQQFDTTQATLGRLSLELQSNTSEQMRQRERRQSLLNQIADAKNTAPTAKFNREEQLATLRRELAELRLTETENSPNVKAKQRQIDTLAGQPDVSGAGSDGANASQAKVGALQASLAETEALLQRLGREQETLQASINTYQGRIERAPSRNVEFEAIMQDYRATRDLYDSVQKRYDAAAIAARAERGQGGDEFRVLDPALPPLGPLGPNRLPLYIGGTFLAIVLGFTLGFIRDRFDTSFHSVDELRAFTHVPVLASIPVIAPNAFAQIPILQSTPISAPTRSVGVWTLQVSALAVAAALALTVVIAGASRYGQGNETVARMLLPRR